MVTGVSKTEDSVMVAASAGGTTDSERVATITLGKVNLLPSEDILPTGVGWAGSGSDR